MKRLLAGTFAWALLSLSWGLPLKPVLAQTTAVVRRDAGPFSYDISEEIRVDGTVSSVLPNASPGMVKGSHLVIATPSGPVDISLGTYGMRGKGALAVTAGMLVEATGIMKTINRTPVLLARNVKVGNHTYAIRNEHGIPISPLARDRANQKAGQNGEKL
jgi:hypothetical protein